MKKFLKITAVIVLSLLIFFVGTFKYRQYQANQFLIPKNANAVVKISVDEIYKTLAANIIANPVYYFKSDLKKDSTNKNDKFYNGLKIPASLYFYNIAGAPSTTFFSRFQIKNVKDFENFLRNTLHLEIAKEIGNINIAKSKLGNFSICYNSKAAALALATQIENYEPILLDILNEKNFIKTSDSQFKKILTRKEHLAFSNKENSGWINFNNGVINFCNEFITNEVIPLSSIKHRKLSENATIGFWLNANFKSIDKKVYKYKNFSLEKDSLLKYYNNNIDFEWTNSIQQTDSVITYEYNDDFEKVEKVSLKKRNIPLFSLNFSTKQNGFKNYLAKQGLVNLDSNILNKNTFPLYKVFIKTDANNINFSTAKEQTVNTDKVSSDDFFYLNIDFIRLNKQLEIPIVTNYFKILKRLEVKGKAIDQDKANLQGKLELKNEDINSLYQILKSF
ncbi:hypothetical protein [Pedobacter jamesrossensis]|uniref:DUF4836 family protein n=1 Tax=Pedobacter jamesrossensis TaxID=1908238 RepID=A0ABV8NK94_9SPHI